MVIFYIVKHGQTLLNRLDLAQGADSPLTDAGKQTAVELGNLDVFSYAVIFSFIFDDGLFFGSK